MKGPNMGLLATLLLSVLIVGYIQAEAEKDFEFAGEKESFRDDEDYMADQEGSGDVDGSGEVQPGSGVPALFRAIINITSLQYTDEIQAAGRDIGRLAITQQLQTALQNFLSSSLPGVIRIRIVDLQPGSLMVTFDIDTDGQQSEEEIIQLLKDMLNRGSFSGYRVSPDGFEFRRIRDTFTCSPRVGPVPRKLPTPFPDNYAYLMINNAFPCNGFVTAWNFQREFPGETVFIGVFRQTSDTNFVLVDATEIPRLQQDRFELDRPILVQKGDFVGVFNRDGDRGGNLAFTTEAGTEVQDYELYQGYRLKMFAKDVMTGAPFQILDFENSESTVMFAVQADMSYINVPAVTTEAPVTCRPDQWTCKNGDCIDLSYYCDQQVDCYDGSDEDNCRSGFRDVDVTWRGYDRATGALTCEENEFRCRNGLQCIPLQFLCNFVDDCGDNSDEVSCGPGPVRIDSFRDGSEPDSYTLSWVRPQAGGGDIISYTIKYRLVTVRRGERTLDGDYIFERYLGDFTEVQVAATSDNYALRSLQPASYYQVEISANNRIGASEPQAFIFRTANAGCRPGEFQCEDGGCIGLNARCDNIPDCADGSDEGSFCVSPVCLEGLEACPQPDGSILCVEKAVGCECAEGEFQCVQGRNCISGSRRCDSRNDCDDGSDEANCPCPDGFFQCLNTPSQECISDGLLCDNVDDCSDGSDEINCGCGDGLWQCADGTCIPDNMRCDDVPQCEDLSDEVGCREPCRSDQFTCADGNCVEGSMRCDGIPQCEDSSDEFNCPTCRADQFTCNDRNCVEARMRCDGVPQCEDGSDEAGCPTCRADQFTCNDRNCVEGRMRCDGVPQCEDGSDEFGCPTEPPSCPPSDFQCESRGFLECIDKRLRCDGYPDCSDSSDEKDCPGCRRDQFTCRTDGRCLPSESKCNGIIECADRSDELGCVCTAEQFQCGDGICIDLSRRCDRRIDCDDQSDELACPCRSGEFQCLNGDCIDEARRCDGRVDCRDRSDEAGCRQPGPCSPPFFNSLATVSEECVRCFCFGQTVQCVSSDLQVSRIALVSQMQFTRRSVGGELVFVDQTLVNYRWRTGEYQVQDMTRVLPHGLYYWQMPNEFLGERLTSYGGEIKYTITYEIQGRSQSSTTVPDVIISGNGIMLFHSGNTVPSPGVPKSVSVSLLETAWERDNGSRRRGDTPVDTQYANREDFMTVLENLEYILIRGTYDRTQTLSRIGGIFMTTAVDYQTDYGQAYLVEECTCPTGYVGLSCQDCAPGFSRITTGDYLGQCVACNCNGHSNDCDPRPGQCLNCQHNTDGPQCQWCRDGYFGDARIGTPEDCQPCPCPLTDRANQFSRFCFMNTDGDVKCANCPVGYEGRRCQRCAEGYVGDPMTPGSSCTKVPVDDYCDPRGSLSTQVHTLTRKCDCRENVDGERCDMCKANTFFLSSSYELGCVRCFCMGVSTSCQSTTWNRAQVGVSFLRDDAGVKMTDMNGNAVQDQRLITDTNNRELVYRTRDLNENTLYWSLPSSFLGDKVTAFGGSLRFTVRYSSRQDKAVSQKEPLVKISGNDITLIHRTSQEFLPNRSEPVNIMMYEQNWFRSDGQPATREHLLMVLADLDYILIRAIFEKPQVDTRLGDATMDIAESRQTRQDRAYAVESCQCPVGYRGLSCEDCDTGYTRSGGGLFLGLCEPCRCNGHSNECDPETGVCRNCQHNTVGDNCEMCAVGFYGDARQGRRDDCQRCPCPLTEAPNQFSPTCILDTDGEVTCTACPAGHTGRRCETCVADYSGNPLKVGDYCRVVTGSKCDCDTRGTVPNTHCHKNTQQCQCKLYTEGPRCARCREGNFYLEANNPQGCLTCFCSGMSDQCSSSSYYRETLRPQSGSDGWHNFVLMNRRMNKIISDGFVVDANRNQVTFNQFEGIQQERESLFFQLPAKFRGDRVTSYGGYLRFTLEFSARSDGRTYRDVDLEIISSRHALRLYHLFETRLQEGRTQTYEILLQENSFNGLRSNSVPTRDTFMNVLSDIAGILIRATYHMKMASVTLRDVSMDTAVPVPTNFGGAPMVEDCRCPEGYTGLSCQRCADGYLRVSDGRGGVGRCVRCNCNGHATSCDPESGRCLEETAETDTQVDKGKDK